ncbi:hypothetical protein KCU65_g5013, partial [Aureobasidium melanogenum]
MDPPQNIDFSIFEDHLPEHQTKFRIWYHDCHNRCRTPWHFNDDGQTTHHVSSYNDPNIDQNKDTDVQIWRLDLLPNSDGDETKRSRKATDVMATDKRIRGFLDSIEKEMDFTDTQVHHDPNDRRKKIKPYAAGTWIHGNPRDVTKSFPHGYALMHRRRDNVTNRKGDLYLWGHPSGKEFNSATKFVVHLKWLIGKMEGDCECSLCRPVPRKTKKKADVETDEEEDEESEGTEDEEE